MKHAFAKLAVSADAPDGELSAHAHVDCQLNDFGSEFDSNSRLTLALSPAHAKDYLHAEYQ